MENKLKMNLKVEKIETSIEYTGLEFVSSFNITGIPSESDLKNTVIVDILIEDEEIIDYKTKSIDIPIFKPRLIDTKNSEVIGVFTKIGEFLTEFKLETRFEIKLRRKSFMYIT